MWAIVSSVWAVAFTMSTVVSSVWAITASTLAVVDYMWVVEATMGAAEGAWGSEGVMWDISASV